MNISEQVLAAFQVEYREHLEAIRTLLAQLESKTADDPRECIDQAFRLAHSLKGGARVCDLRPAEELGHRLEAVFEQIRNGTLGLDEEVTTTIKQVLDALEDWMAAREREAAPPAPRSALAAIEHLLCRNAVPEPAAASADGAESPTARLQAAFRREYPQYLAELEQWTAPPADGRETRPDDWNEAYRLAHNLRASADAAEIANVEAVCAELEALIGGFCEADSPAGSESRERLRERLAAVRRELATFAADGTAADAPSPVGETPEDRGPENAPPAEPATKPLEAASNATPRAADTVRISTAGLDALLLSSRQLLTESLSQEQFGRELDDARRQIVDMQREHESFRRAAATGLRRLELMPEFNRIARYFESVDRDVQTLARRSRQLCLSQKRIARSLQSRARQIEQDVGQARMVPAETIYQGFRKMVRDLARSEGKQAEFFVTGFDVRADRMVFQALKDPLIHMLRNCLVHGIESPDERRAAGKDATGRIDLRIETTGNRLTVDVDDDGRGIDRERVYRQAIASGVLTHDDRREHTAEEIENLIYQPGFSTSETLTEVAGRGMGLSVVREAVTRLQGDVQVCRKETAGTRFRITVPLSVSTHRLLLVALGKQTYALPVHGIERLLRVKEADRETIEGKPVVMFRDRPVPLVPLGDLLGAESAAAAPTDGTRNIVVLKAGARRVAVSVDGLLAEKDLLMQDLDRHAAAKRYLGAILLEDGTAALVLNPAELLLGFRGGAQRAAGDDRAARPARATPRVLVVDDSFTTRTLEKSILEANGYQVGIAVDGLEGLNQLQRERYDLVISDVEMPRMDGFALLASIKQDPRLASVPVVLVTSRDRREDQEKGLDLGADAYIVKQKFDHQSWLSVIREIVEA